MNNEQLNIKFESDGIYSMKLNVRANKEGIIAVLKKGLRFIENSSNAKFKVGTTYYYVTSWGDVAHTVFNGGSFDCAMVMCGNAFVTEDEATEAVDRIMDNYQKLVTSGLALPFSYGEE